MAKVVRLLGTMILVAFVAALGLSFNLHVNRQFSIPYNDDFGNVMAKASAVAFVLGMAIVTLYRRRFQSSVVLALGTAFSCAISLGTHGSLILFSLLWAAASGDHRGLTQELVVGLCAIGIWTAAGLATTASLLKLLDRKVVPNATVRYPGPPPAEGR